jgi:hypothetical protein
VKLIIIIEPQASRGRGLKNRLDYRDFDSGQVDVSSMWESQSSLLGTLGGTEGRRCRRPE